MPTRVDSMPLPSSHRRDYDHRPYDYGYSRRPSPPPIAAISHSPSLSVSSIDRSSVSSPAPRRSPTDHGAAAADVHSAYRDPYYSHSNSLGRMPSRSYHHDSLRDTGRTHHASSYSYPRPHAEHRYSHDSHPYHVPSYSSGSISSYNSTRENSLSYPLPGQPYHQIGYTDDAATKLSDRMRRRCYNCSTTDTSTWRRSNLSPGKVLCNKCGLFERTHGRSRPEQFPHRRGPLAATTTTSNVPPSAMRARSPPLPQTSMSTQLPPISAHVGSLAPHQYTHPSIAPLSSVPDARRSASMHGNGALPNLNSWANSPAPAPVPRASGGAAGYAPGSPGRLHDIPRARSPPRFGHVDAEAAVA